MVEFYLDEINELWCGPSSSGGNLHWARFEGYGVGEVGEVWVLMRSSKGEHWIQISALSAQDHMKNERYQNKQSLSESCPDCKGTGQYVGFLQIETCTLCKGTGIAPQTLPAKDNLLDEICIVNLSPETNFEDLASQLMLFKDGILVSYSYHKLVGYEELEKRWYKAWGEVFPFTPESSTFELIFIGHLKYLVSLGHAEVTYRFYDFGEVIKILEEKK